MYTTQVLHNRWALVGSGHWSYRPDRGLQMGRRSCKAPHYNAQLVSSIQATNRTSETNENGIMVSYTLCVHTYRTTPTRPQTNLLIHGCCAPPGLLLRARTEACRRFFFFARDCSARRASDSASCFAALTASSSRCSEAGVSALWTSMGSITYSW
jgi:hypothetical protein